MNLPLYHFCKRGAWLGFKLLWWSRIDGVHHVPRTGPVVLAANHLSLLDPPLVGSSCPRVVRFLARDTLGRIPLVGRWMRAVGTLFVDRKAPTARVISTLVGVLAEGGVVVVFPEGTRSRDGRLGAFKRGLLLLAKKTGATVVPVGVRGSFHAFPRGKRFPRPFRRCSVSFGAPMSAAEVMAEGGLEELRRRVAQLSGQAMTEEVGDVSAPASV